MIIICEFICLNERLQQNNLITEFRTMIYLSLRIINANASVNLYKKYAIYNTVLLFSFEFVILCDRMSGLELKLHLALYA